MAAGCNLLGLLTPIQYNYDGAWNLTSREDAAGNYPETLGSCVSDKDPYGFRGLREDPRVRRRLVWGALLGVLLTGAIFLIAWWVFGVNLYATPDGQGSPFTVLFVFCVVEGFLGTAFRWLSRRRR